MPSKPPAAEPETPTETTEPLGTAADAVVDTLTATQQEALHGLETASTAVLQGVTSVQREIAEFVAERIRVDMETQQALLRCKTLGEVHVVQAEFFRTAFDQYASEASRLVRLGGEMVSRSLDRGPH